MPLTRDEVQRLCCRAAFERAVELRYVDNLADYMQALSDELQLVRIAEELSEDIGQVSYVC